jgi:tyrosyl-tRNA synthetase
MTNNELSASLQEAIALVAMATHLINDKEDRLEMRQMWEDKANTLVREYFNNVRRINVSEEARHQDWIGD